MSKVVFFPHVKNDSGGAGRYNTQILEDLRQSKCEVKLIGPYANTYDKNNFSNIDANVPIYANYDGVKLRHIIYYAIKNLMLAIKIKKNIIRLIEAIKDYDEIVLTTSIFLILVPEIRKYSDIKITILIQENLLLTKNNYTYGKNKYLKQCDRVVSITKEWQSRAMDLGLKSCYVPNKYLISAHSGDFLVNKKIIYVGGGGSIKGFDFLLDSLRLVRTNNFVLYMAGSYSEKQRKKIIKLKSNANIKILGEVNGIESYIEDSDFLLLPIRAAHFCRPAIEAGLCGKSFLISDLEGINEFAINNINCLRFKKDSTDEFAQKIDFLFENENYLKSISVGNCNFSREYIAEIAKIKFKPIKK